MSISTHNVRVYLLSETFRSLYFLVPIYLIYLKQYLNISQISFLIGFQFFVQLLLELPTGAIADIFGKRITIVLSYVFDTFFFLGYLYAHTYISFLIIYALSGIGEALRSGASEAIVYDSLKQDRRENEFPLVGAKQGIYFQIGLVTATVLGGFLYQVNRIAPILLVTAAQTLAGISAFFYSDNVV
jgi:MFS family permease